MSGAIKIEKIKSFDELLQSKGPFSSMFRDVLLKAQSLNASDIHFEPKREFLVIRLRVNGDLFEYGKVQSAFSSPFLFEVKKLTGMSIAKKGKPQDSRVSYPSLGIDLRGSAIPSVFDDKLVYRIIDNNFEMSLDKLGHSKKAIDALLNSVQYKNGLVLMSGPTGSGKSSTLYAMLASVDRKKLNVITIEDPVERLVEDTTSVHIRKGFNFSNALKAAMRQDPDVIFVGEIRDEESASIAIEASNTGHLVISTIHANDCLSVLERLEGLGVERKLIEKNLKFVAAQRLVKKLCPKCKIKGSDDFYIRNDEGCSSCHKSGIIGRRPIIDYLDSTMILKSYDETPSIEDTNRLREIARKYLVAGDLCQREWRAIE